MLGGYGVQHRLLDANIEGLLHIFRMPFPHEKEGNTWTQRAFRNRERNIASLKDPVLYHHLDRYKRAVSDIERALSKVTSSCVSLGLVNYEHKGLSPVKSEDLLAAAEKPELNPFYPYFRSRLEGLFHEKEPSAIGISVNYLSQALSAFSIIGFIRRDLPRLKVIMGGGLITSWLRNPRWKNPFAGIVDHLVAGPGEDELLSLLGVNETGKEIPRPDYRPLPQDYYLSPGFVLPYSASSGCYWHKCSFCPEKAEGNLYAAVPSRQVISDLKALAEINAPTLIHLLDNAVSPALLDVLSRDTIGVPWYGFARIGPPLNDSDFCMALKRAGCVMLKLGIESGDQGVLDSLEKGTSVEEASVVLKNLKRAGIAAYVYLIFGTPAETEAAAKKTLEFTVKHSDNIDFMNLAIFNMPVCGENETGIETRAFYEGDLSLYTDFIHPHGWDRKRVRMFLENAFKKHPAVSIILKHDPPLFTSNHAPFFVMGRCGK
jgi:hypothetical protein